MLDVLDNTDSRLSGCCSKCTVWPEQRLLSKGALVYMNDIEKYLNLGLLRRIGLPKSLKLCSFSSPQKIFDVRATYE
jgi:hypothetical protein